MELQQKIMSDITVHMKYAKYNPEVSRRETWDEICNRNINMHLQKFSYLGAGFCNEIIRVYDTYVRNKKVLPSMRSMQFAGKPIELSPNRIYNCAYLPIDTIEAFSETMFLLLGGTGVGYSVQRHHVNKLPMINKPKAERTYKHLIGDSIVGWAEAVRVLFDAYTGKRTSTPRFDYSDIRLKGSPLKTSGGKAPGPAPLRRCLVTVENMLLNMEDGHQITPLEAHDMVCHIADAVLAGGIRRAALISLFNADDNEMINAKSGHFWDLNPQRMRANNSAVLIREKCEKDFFNDLWNRIQTSGSGEPGIYFSNDKDWGTNPCCEIALRPYQFCNLTEVNVSDITDEEDLIDRVEAAAFLGTLQASYTDFHYLRERWKRTTEKEALIGVSMTGIASNAVKNMDLNKAAEEVKSVNERVSLIIGINSAARTTCVKPAGTTSCVVGTSSGIHAWYSNYYIRRIRVLKTEPIYLYLKEKIPELIEDDIFDKTQAMIMIPQKTPERKVVTRDESALSMLNRVKKFSTNWVRTGHHDGINTHNVSATVNIREDEWDIVKDWMWKNRDYYNGLAVLPFDNGVYQQAPFESIEQEQYEELFTKLKEINLIDIKEENDNTNLQGEIACAGGVCEI
jgi:ribonucleoside-diphosphate reductase alpha chain